MAKSTVNNVAVERESQSAFALEVGHQCAGIVDLTIKERCLILHQAAQKLAPCFGMGIGMMLLVHVGTKQTSEHLYIGCVLAFCTWLGLMTKLQAEVA